MKENSFLNSVKGVFKEMLYMESENTNTDIHKLSEEDKCENKNTCNVETEQSNKTGQKFQ